MLEHIGIGRVGNDECIVVITDSPSRSICRMFDWCMNNGKVAENRNLPSITGKFKMPGTIQISLQFKISFVAEIMFYQFYGKFQTDRFIMIGNRGKYDSFYIFLRIQACVEFEFDCFSFPVCCAVPVRNCGSLLKRLLRRVGKAAFEVVKK